MNDETEISTQDTPSVHPTSTVPPYRRYKPKTGFHTWLEMLSWRSPTATKCVADAMTRLGRPKLGAKVESYVRHGSAPLETDHYDFWCASGSTGRVWCEEVDKLYRGSPDVEECIIEYAHDAIKSDVMCLLTHLATSNVVCASLPMDSSADRACTEKMSLDLAWLQLHLGRLVDA